MLKAKVDELRKIKLNEDLENPKEKELGEDFIKLIRGISEPAIHNDTQYAWDSGYVKALEEVSEILKKRGICR
ncbi:hypothetical protein SAMN02745136_00525 [Anaerocolumna jejuensis DSM 15929]|uniref:Uncharacterized protein n=1 Tax=Anaerocolumna jejuensis DSM 15929 TaxID=1121322 RepID=A0A1M6KP23_9FIRM|nr:hypothetical protein [Anaerocolumna jejuensis]SHJ60670.1 hypothetical protein SAMN02745136_00525 [Anaerocolumna jejuensis DSM 15929]